jgi:hypothetical protein
MKLPQGNLRRRRVVTDLATPLSNALDAALTGYARLESGDSLLLEKEGVGIVTFDDGVPVAIYHTGTDNGGPAALSDIAVTGPSRIELYELDAASLAPVHDAEELRVSPGQPAEQLAGDDQLAARTRESAPDSRTEAGTTGGLAAVESFLDDEQRIADIRDRARSQAREQAREWGFDVPD